MRITLQAYVLLVIQNLIAMGGKVWEVQDSRLNLIICIRCGVPLLTTHKKCLKCRNEVHEEDIQVKDDLGPW
jgi:predicted nucleic-acid-binding Zn-ribbon protein